MFQKEKREKRERERKGGGRGKSGNHKKNKIEEKFSELKEISLQNKWNIMELTQYMKIDSFQDISIIKLENTENKEHILKAPKQRKEQFHIKILELEWHKTSQWKQKQ